MPASSRGITRGALLRLGARLAAALTTLGAFAAAAQTPPSATAEQIKAAYLHKFLGYVDWPEQPTGPNTPYVIGVAESEGVYQELARLVAGHPVQGHPVQVRKLAALSAATDVQLVYFGDLPRAKAAQALQLYQGQPVLTVTDLPPPMLPGAMLDFVLVEGRIRFLAAPGAAEQAHLKLSSRLLSVAAQVEGMP
jgi:hypothetical protein